MKILVSGPLLSMSGYGNHARQILDFVLELYSNEEIFCDVKQWGNTNWNLSNEFTSNSSYNKVIDNFISETELNDIRQNKINYFDISYQVSFPSEWDTSLAKYNVGVFAGIESTICCEKWLDKIDLMSDVVVPSQHALSSINKAAEEYCFGRISTPIYVIPEWFYVEIEEETNSSNQILEKVKTENNLLIVGQIGSFYPNHDRKNIIKTLDACIESLKENKNLSFGIVLKLFCENNSLSDFEKTKKIVSKYIEITRKSSMFVPKIYILHGNLKPAEMCEVYKSEKISCLVSGTRGEGFGLTFLEAAASGLPIIATNWSAHTEFLDHYLQVDYNLVDLPESLTGLNTKINEYSNIWVPGGLWAEFDKKSMKKCIKKIVEKDNSFVKESNEIIKQQKSILNKYSKNSIMRLYKKQFGR